MFKDLHKNVIVVVCLSFKVYYWFFGVCLRHLPVNGDDLLERATLLSVDGWEVFPSALDCLSLSVIDWDELLLEVCDF